MKTAFKNCVVNPPTLPERKPLNNFPQVHGLDSGFRTMRLKFLIDRHYDRFQYGLLFSQTK